ncbi:MAG: hypothetical protein MRY63_04270, partial [Neomegalonema sp.]|nr:hypothetical protein [Neomegalonema sp.]
MAENEDNATAQTDTPPEAWITSGQMLLDRLDQAGLRKGRGVSVEAQAALRAWLLREVDGWPPRVLAKLGDAIIRSVAGRGRRTAAWPRQIELVALIDRLRPGGDGQAAADIDARIDAAISPALARAIITRGCAMEAIAHLRRSRGQWPASVIPVFLLDRLEAEALRKRPAPSDP